MMSKVNAIGGYFNLDNNHFNHYHKSALRLNTAKNCLEYILRLRKYSRVYIPTFTCKIVQAPFIKLGINFQEYTVNECLEPSELPRLYEGEAFLYTNYFGLKSDYVKRLADRLGTKLIVDNAQAFFEMPIEGIDTFYSARKFFGVPDGAYLYTDSKLNEEFPKDISYNRLTHLFKRIDLGPEQAFEYFNDVERRLSNEPIKYMSAVTESLLSNIEYDKIIKRRRINFKFLHSHLGERNLLKFKFSDDMTPMVYPYLSSDLNLKKKLISQRIFVPTYWPNVLEYSENDSYERYLTTHLCPLPIDQRYRDEDMYRIIDNVIK